MNSHAAPSLFTPLRVGALQLSHRIFLADRHDEPAPPSPRAAVPIGYYAARASDNGLLACSVTPGYVAGGSRLLPLGIQTAADVAHWRNVTDAVHDRGGLAVARIGSVCWAGASPPDVDEIDTALSAYRTAAENAGDAGFDGIELAALQGSLPHVLLSSSTEAGIEFLAGVFETLFVAWRPDRVGLNLPLSPDTGHWRPVACVLESLAVSGIAYLHLASRGAANPALPLEALAFGARDCLGGVLLVSGDWTREAAETAVRNGAADAVGPQAFALDSDLPRSWRHFVEK